MGYLDNYQPNKRNHQGSIVDKTDLIFSNGERVNYTLGYTFNGGGTSVALSDSAAVANSMHAYHIRIIDQHGNEASANLNPASPSTVVNLSVANLVASDEFEINVVVIKGRAGQETITYQSNVRCIEGNKANVTGTINEFWSTGTLNVQISATKNGASLFAQATVADGGTQSIGSAAIGDTVIVTLALQNTSANYPFDVTAIAVTGDGSTDQSILLPATIAPDYENSLYKIAIDTATAGAPKAAVVTITNTTTNVSYAITIQLTVS